MPVTATATGASAHQKDWINSGLLGEFVLESGELSSTGYWSLDANGNDMVWSDQLYRVLGWQPGQTEPSLDAIRAAFPEQDRSTFDKELRLALSENAPFIFEGELTTQRGRTKRVRAMGKRLQAPDSNGHVFVGLIQDISGEFARQQRLGKALQWLETAGEIAQLGYWYVDVTDQSLEWSAEVYRIHGYEPGAFTPTVEQAIDAYHPDDRDRLAEAVQRGQETGEPWSLDARLVKAGGEICQVVASGRPLYERGKLVALFGVIQDVTQRHLLAEHDRLFMSLLQQSPQAVCITDADGLCQWTNAAFEKLTGFTHEEMTSQKPGNILQGPDTDLATVARMNEALSVAESLTEDIINYHKNGEPYWTRLSVFPHRDGTGQLTHFMSIQIDITNQKEADLKLEEQARSLAQTNFHLERQRRAAESLSQKERKMREELQLSIQRSRELQDELRRLAHFDELTGLPNRRRVLKRAAAEHKRAARYGRPLSILLLDIDRFKSINDHYGHQVGDEAICHVATLLRTSLRDDIDLPGRIGGEEFIVLLPETNLAGAIRTAERVRTSLHASPFVDDRLITCSFGVCEATEHATLEEAIRIADQKLYTAKEQGRDRVAY